MNIGKAYNMIVDKLNQWLNSMIVMLPNLAVAILVVIGFYILAKLLKKVSRNLLNRFSSHEAINHLLSNITFFVVLSVGFFIALGLLQLDKAVTSLLAGAGIIGLALGFAFQDMAANFISGIAIALKQPFKINDLIKSNDFFGVVKKISLRTTEILTPQGQTVLIPNKTVFQNPLINYSTTGRRRIDLKVGISYGDDLEKVKEVTLNVIRNISNQDPEREWNCSMKNSGIAQLTLSLEYG
jgi:small conductance mechanosensitive channel